MQHMLLSAFHVAVPLSLITYCDFILRILENLSKHSWQTICVAVLTCFLWHFWGSIVDLKTQSFEFLLACGAMIDLLFKKLKPFISSSRLRQYLKCLKQVFYVSCDLIPVSCIFMNISLLKQNFFTKYLWQVFSDYPRKLIYPMFPLPHPFFDLFSGGALQIPLCVPFP